MARIPSKIAENPEPLSAGFGSDLPRLHAEPGSHSKN
jgi:hypothetical protein